MMTRFVLPVVFFAFASLAQPRADAADAAAARTIELGGMRNAKATVLVDGDEYTIAAEMLPVRVFDETTNREVNRRLLAHLAFDALRQTLTDEPAVLAIAGAVVGNLDTTEEICRLTVRVPLTGVELGPPPTGDASGRADESFPPALQMPSLMSPQSGLLERRQEYSDLFGLVEVLQADVHSIPAAPEGQAEGDDPPTAGDLTGRTTALFEALARQVEKDLMLLSFEKQLLLDELHTQEQQLLTAIRAAASSRPAHTPPENNHDADPDPVLDDRDTGR